MSYEVADLRRRMEGSLQSLKDEFAGLRTGRASTGMLDPITVEAYGSRMPINQVGSITAPEPRLLAVQVWDASLVKATEKAIRDANLGLNPQTDGTTIRVPVPQLTEERRKELVKIAGKYTETARVAIRNIRRDGIDALKLAKLPEDDSKRRTEEIQKVTDDFIKKVDVLLADKEKDVMTV